MESKGYIYIRDHESYEKYNVYKLGITKNIKDRDSTYLTGEPVCGEFIYVIEIPLIILNIMDNILKYNFIKYQFYNYGGTEFYDRCIIDLIVPILIKYNIDYKILNKHEIIEFNRTIREYNKNYYDKYMINIINEYESYQNKDLIQLTDLKEEEEHKCIYTPREYQIEIIEKTYNYFQNNDKCILVLMCGVGKTLISLWITEKLKCNKIIIGVPNLLLLEQWKKTIIELFPKLPLLLINGNIQENYIKEFLDKNKNNCIIITTYASSYKINNISIELQYIFNIKINDEVHHLTSNNINNSGDKSYIKMLEIKSEKQLSLTATLKLIGSIDNNIISNDNKNIFGEIIDQKNLLWAIKKNIICDYDIQIIDCDIKQLEDCLYSFNINDKNNKRLFLSTYIALRSIFQNHTHRLLIYSNNKDNSENIIKYIKIIIENEYFKFSDKKLYYSAYNSDLNKFEQENIINNFENHKFGIISCVYCLGEGWDFPLLDGVVFAENMTSNIRIVQSALRAGRKNKNEINKKSKLILPILDINFENNENPDFKKVKEVIYQMGLEDSEISYKIKVYKIDINKDKSKLENKDNKSTECIGKYDTNKTEYIKEKTISRENLGISYEKARQIIADKNIKTKEDYYKLCKINYLLHKQPDNYYKDKFLGWIDYLSIEQKYYDLEICKDKIYKYLSLHPEINKIHLDLSKICIELCKLDNMFPPHDLWCEYYNIKDLTELIKHIKNEDLIEF
jgi:superfamily II DNA or RNA helicase